MFGRKIKLMSLSGFNVHIDASWVFLALLIVWTLSAGYFPAEIRGLETSTYWLMGVFGALGLFASLILHEFSHSYVARRMGLEIKGITLFIFGGVAEMEKEPENARTEFWMAIAGPLTSLFLGAAFFGLEMTGVEMVWPAQIIVVLGYLWRINLILALFNLLPGFPLDGGRILRSALWAWKDDIRWATHWAVKSGNLIGTVLMILGILSFLAGNFIGGLWWFLIAMFLKGAAKSSEGSMLVREYLKGEPVGRYMNLHPITISPRTTVEDAVNNYFFSFHHRNFPVVEGEELLGIVSIDDIKKLDRSKWNSTMIEEIYTAQSETNTVDPNMDSLDALQKMKQEGRDTLMIFDHGLKGIISIKDLFAFLSVKLDLEGGAGKSFRF